MKDNSKYNELQSTKSQKLALITFFIILWANLNLKEINFY